MLHVRADTRCYEHNCSKSILIETKEIRAKCHPYCHRLFTAAPLTIHLNVDLFYIGHGPTTWRIWRVETHVHTHEHIAHRLQHDALHVYERLNKLKLKSSLSVGDETSDRHRSPIFDTFVRVDYNLASIFVVAVYVVVFDLFEIITLYINDKTIIHIERHNDECEEWKWWVTGRDKKQLEGQHWFTKRPHFSTENRKRFCWLLMVWQRKLFRSVSRWKL